MTRRFRASRSGADTDRSRSSFERKTKVTLFLFSTVGILAITALAKLWSALGASKALIVTDPLFGVSYKHLLAGAAVAEIIVATICVFGRSRKLAVSSVAYLCTNFLLYRICLSWIGWKQPCGCMGSLTDALHIKAQTADHIALGLLLYMLAASCGVLFVEWWRTRSNLGNPDRPAMKENETAGKER